MVDSFKSLLTYVANNRGFCLISLIFFIAIAGLLRFSSGLRLLIIGINSSLSIIAKSLKVKAAIISRVVGFVMMETNIIAGANSDNSNLIIYPSKVGCYPVFCGAYA